MNPQDLRIDSWPPSASGMHVGMPRGVKIQHKPTGLVVTCDSERSQHKNRDKAMAELIEKLSQLQPNAQVQGRPLGVAEACAGGSVPCNAQLGR